MTLKEIIEKIGMSKDDVIREAECVEEYGEWSYPALIGYSAEELRAVARDMK